ncbi:thyroid hormone-induced protein B-like [Podarcis raffonei]|uniref:thyroid hormone-induced protein B-like n=1 Tax=Podarcis raffonei TaxID=65483 RepID=UPI0023298E23|nr:thyroid hormone-induced protein B-like [Podarcis raffonei]
MGTLQSLQIIGFLLCLLVTDIKGEEERVPTLTRDVWAYDTDILASCDFNDNLNPFCNWKPSCSSRFGSWIRSRGGTPTLGTGPEGDYPDGKGYFIYQEASNLLPFDTTILESQELVVSREICIDFWYHMSGSEDSNELKVVILTDEDEFMLWHRKGAQSSDWLHGSTSVHFLRERDIKV